MVILINTLYLYTPWRENSYEIMGQNWGAFDIAGFCIAILLFVIQISQFLKDRKVLAKIDPLKPYDPSKLIKD